MPKPQNLTELIKLLHAEMGDNGLDTADVPKVQALLESYQSCREDWEKFALVEQGKYTRNLVDDGNGKFNLMILCWDKSVSSAIHDHSNSHCLVKVLDGHLTESLYDWPDAECTSHGLKLKQEATYSTDAVTYMHDKIGLHRITNNDAETPAISLHLYSPPFDTCKTFCRETGQERAKGKCIFYSVNGVKSPTICDLQNKYCKGGLEEDVPPAPKALCKPQRKPL